MATRLWTFLTTDIKELVSTKTLDGTANAAKAIFELSAALKPGNGIKVEQLAPLVSQLDSLLDVLNSPLGEVVEKGVPFVSIATGLLRFYLETSKVPPSLEKCIALGCQAAYLESFQELLGRDPDCQKRLNQSASEDVTEALKELAELEVTPDLARRAVTQFPQTELSYDLGFTELRIDENLGRHSSKIESLHQGVALGQRTDA